MAENQTYGVMPSGERQNIPDRYRIQSDQAHIKVRDLNAYDFCQHTYDGSHGYRDGSYLIPHPREQFYETRRESSYYVNAYAPIINAMVLPVFNTEIQRSTENEMYSGFIENCDNAGTPLSDIMETAITHARMYGLTFLVMDNVTAPPEIVQEAISARAYPYIYERQPQSVECTEVDKYGSLKSITFFERCEKIGKEERRLFRCWDKVGWELYYNVVSEDTTKRVVVEDGVHGLGVIPVIPITGFCKSASLAEFPNPPTYDLAMLTFALFNKESQVVTLEQFQAFSLLVTSDYDINSLTVGPTTFLNCGVNAKFAPQYISPNTDNVRVLVEDCERLKEEIYKQAGQKGVIGVKSQESGVSKEWDFRAEEAVLKKTALVAADTEDEIENLFGLYIKQDIEVEVKYPDKFAPNFLAQRIDNGLKILREMPPEQVASEIWQEIVKAFWDGDKDRAELISEAIAIVPEDGADNPDTTDTEETDEGQPSEQKAVNDAA
jgi:hypothetical protein